MNTIEMIAMYADSSVTVGLFSVFGTMSVYLIFTLMKRQWDKTTHLEEELVYSEHRAQQNLTEVFEDIERDDEIRKHERARLNGQVFDELIDRQMKSIDAKGISEKRASHLEKAVSDIDSKLISAVDSAASIAGSIPGMREKLVDEIPDLVTELTKTANASAHNAEIVGRMENSTVNLRHHLQTTKSRLSSINGAFGGGN
jgi:hypothetical protein